MVNPNGTIVEAQSRLNNLLNPESLEQPIQEPEAEVEPESAEVEEYEESESEYEEADTDTEEQEAEAETSEDDDTEAEEPKYTVKVNGEELEVTLDDLRKGYMMESDYRKKTQEVAEQRKTFESKLDDLSAKIQDAEIVLQSEVEDLASDENRKLREYDPAAWLDKQEAVTKKAEKLKQMKAKRDEEFQSQNQARLQKEAELLTQAIPEWLDQDTANKEGALIQKAWQDMGFTESDLARFDDHRLIVMSRKAALYDKIANAKPEEKKVKPKPKAAKPGTSTNKVDRRTREIRDKRDAMKKSGGNMKLAANVISDLL